METKYTPAKIASENIHFSIPLYQRLFEWQKPEIIQLLNDLKAASGKIPEQPYYIGMLTAYRHQIDGFDLVDGQQRFTVLMLMGIVFKWNNFLLSGTNLRLSFRARTKDEQYLKSKINGDPNIEYTNAKMDLGIQYIRDYVDKFNDDEKKKFENYIRNYLTFFVSYLPENYKLHDLNRYFEAMNATGRGLENHEILKVNLLKQLNYNKEDFTKIWNLISDMDKPLIRQWSEKENIADFRKRQSNALTCLNDTIELFKLCNNSDKSPENISDFKTIRAIENRNVAPAKQIRSIGERAILNFPEFLLQILWLQLTDEERKKTSDFFNVHKLQETFKTFLKNENVELFFKNLLKYRILFDYFIIRISNNDQNLSTYTLAFKEDIAESIDRERLIKYQSMLYVSISSNIWLSKALAYLAYNASKFETISFYNELVDFDNNRQQKDISTLSLKYGKIDRYWFWRLDYYLWEEEFKKVKEDKLTNAVLNQWHEEMEKAKAEQSKAILDYSFRPNRSIEHLHPQTNIIPWDSDMLNSFGNLAMISPSFNSTQSNDDENVKFARIENQIKGKYMLESIKLLLMYQKAKEKNVNWNVGLAKEHGNEMIDILVNSFKNSEEYKNIRKQLSDQKIS